ncbi:MAG: hypothetical protein ACXIU7_09100 [Roseinatronobacter sp.]
MRYLEVRHPFFRPLWRRLLVTGICALWSGVEFLIGSPFFGVLTGALALFCLYALFWRFDPAAFADPPEHQPRP